MNITTTIITAVTTVAAVGEATIPTVSVTVYLYQLSSNFTETEFLLQDGESDKIDDEPTNQRILLAIVHIFTFE